MLRLSKKLSLKTLSANIFWHNIQQMPVKHDEPLPIERIEEVLDYNENDVLITKELAKNHLKDQINLRLSIQKEYNIKCLSSDNIQIASNLLLKQYAEAINQRTRDFKDKQTWRKQVVLKDIILPFVEFDKTECIYSYKKKNIACNSLYSLLEHLKSRVVKTTKEMSYSILTRNPNGTNLMIDIGSGGAHGISEGHIWEPKKDEVIITSDVGSLYPTLGTEWEFVPGHLNKKIFVNLYKEIKEKRLKAKKEGNKTVSEAFKLVLNGTYGLYNNDYSWLKDMKPVLQITVNGQLLLCKVVEECQKNGINVLMVNTDGVEVLMKKELQPIYQDIINCIQEQFRVEFEHGEYTKIVAMNINNYSAQSKEGKIKSKGLFVEEPDLGNSHDFLIIPKALNNHFFKGISIKQTLDEETDIFKFTACPRVDKKYTVWYRNEKQIQNLNRFFASTNGAYLYKQKEGGNMENLLKGQAITLFNRFEEKSIKDYHIDYKFYENEINKIINELQPAQRELFN